MHRRQFVAGALTAGAVSLGGCTASAAVPPPRVPQQQLNDGGWERVDEETGVVFERSVASVSVTATQHTLRFSDVGLRSEIDERTLGNLSDDLMVFFATRVNFNPNIDNLPAGVGRAEIMDAITENANAGFREQLQAAGLQNISESGTGTVTVDTGEQAGLTRYSAEFPFEGIRFGVTDEEAIQIPGRAIAIEGQMAVWHHGDFALIAGGAYPAENFETTVTDSLSSAIDVTIDIDLNLTPKRYAQEVTSLLKGVQ